MNISRNLVLSAGLLLFSGTAVAETFLMQASSYFIRSTPNFGSSRRNIVGVLTRGSTFELLERRRRADGSEALRIRVIATARGGNVNPSQTDEYWIYKSNSTDFVSRGGPPAPQAAPCPECDRDGGAPIPGRTREDLARISREATRTAEEAPAPPAPAPTRRPPASPGAVNFDQSVVNYSASAQVRRTIDYALRHKTARSRRRCYRSVKDALVAGGLIRSWYSDLAAANAKNTLKQRGFVNLLEREPYRSQITSPSQAPKGAVLVYSSGTPCGRGASRVADCGHVEIKVGGPGEPGYVSDYRSETAINETPRARRYGSNYRLIGVMVKPM